MTHSSACDLAVLIWTFSNIIWRGVLADSSISNTMSEEYCQLETFNPQCLKNEVIVIVGAVYGRHRTGKCIMPEESTLVNDDRYFGCHANVAAQMNAKCAGKRQCEVRIPDADLERTRSCLPGLQMFLEISFSCIEVVEPERSCSVIVSSKKLHLAPIKSNDRLQCGTKAQPWIFEAPAGQRIAIRLLDFSLMSASASSDWMAETRTRSDVSTAASSCVHQQFNYPYGYVIDKVAPVGKKNVSMCGGNGSKNDTNVYVSTSNSVELFLVNISEQITSHHINFLISFQAIGCTNLMPPESAWIKRQDDTIIIGCYTSRQTWQLRCEEGKWIGVVSSCTDEVIVSVTDRTAVTHVAHYRLHNYEVAMVVAIGFAGLAVCLIIVCCGVVGLHRFYAKSRLLTSEASSWHKPTTVQHGI